MAATNTVVLDIHDPDDIQWTDAAGDNPALNTAFYYQVAAYDDHCGAEGPR